MSELPAAPLVELPDNPSPPGAEPRWIEAADGTRLRFALWTRSSARRGLALLLGGRSEFIEKHFEATSSLLARGFDVATLDWRGQGLSDRKLSCRRKGHVGDFAEYQLDLDALLVACRERGHADVALVVAHSMGGHNILRALAEKRLGTQLAILCSPMLGIRSGPLGTRGLNALSRALCAVGLADRFVPLGKAEDQHEGPFEGNRLTHDRERFDRIRDLLEEEPDLGIGAPTIGWLYAATRSILDLRSTPLLASISSPVAIFSAAADQVVTRADQEHAARSIPRGSFRVVDGARHEILCERDGIRAEFWRRADELIERSLV